MADVGYIENNEMPHGSETEIGNYNAEREIRNTYQLCTRSVNIDWLLLFVVGVLTVELRISCVRCSRSGTFGEPQIE